MPSRRARAYRHFATACARIVAAGITRTSTNSQTNSMKTQIFGILMSAVALFLLSVPLNAAQLTDQNKNFLAAYEKAHAALAADDLNSAKAAAAGLGSEGAELAKSSSLKDARAAFEKLSRKAKQLTAGQPGYHVYHCPMLNKDWVQTSTTTANPYGGKGMAGCGEIQK